MEKSVAIICEFQLFGNNNAASVRIFNYAQALSKDGMRVFLLSLKDYYMKDNLVELSTRTWGFRGGKPSNVGIRDFFNKLTLLVTEEHLQGILFYPSPNPKFELCFLWWKYRNHFKNVFCEINEVRFYEQTYVNSFTPFKRIIYKFVTKNSENLTRYYRGLVCISENIRDYFSKYNTNSIIIPILSDISNEFPEKKICKKELVRFVFTGNVAIEKENLVELFKGLYLFDKEYTSWELLMYGPILDSNRKIINDILQKLKLNNKIHLMGEVMHSQIFNILHNADCLILPRRNTKQNYYGFSTKLSEYAVSGTPIILTDSGVVFNYFRDGKDCLKVEGYEASGFYIQFLRFTKMTAIQRQDLAKEAYQTAKKNFDWRLYSKTLSDFLTQ